LLLLCCFVVFASIAIAQPNPPFNAEKLIAAATEKILAAAADTKPNVYPTVITYTSPAPNPPYRWSTSSAGGWTSGFFPGELWALYNHTKDQKVLSLAKAWTEGIRSQQFNTGTHDVGFMVFYSFSHGYLFTKDADYKNVTLNAAHSLSTRFNPKVGCTRSWPGYHFPVIIDNMMNIELLFWAGLNGGPKEYFDMAVSHADVTAKNHIRPAGNSWHLVDYDPDTGAVLEVCNCPQGLNQTNGTWARGQAWAMYGYVIAYRYTQFPRFLQMAIKVSDWFLNNLPSDYVPYWDFAAPHTQSRDSSAASIGASALIELSDFLKPTDPTAAAKYRSAAYNILLSLSSANYSAATSYSEAILLHATGGEGSGMDASYIFGDYYYVEALIKSLYIY